MNFNIPSIVGILILIGGVPYIFIKAKKNVFIKAKINAHKISAVFGLWLLILVPFIFISINNFGTKGFFAFREWIRLLTLFMIFLLSYQLSKKSNFQKFLNLPFLSLGLPLSVGIHQLITHGGLTIKGIHRIYGTIAHPNSFALYIVLFIGLTYWKLRTTNRKLWGFLLLVELGVLIMTISFGGYIMFGILFLFLLLKQKIKQKIIIIFLMTLFLLIIFHIPSVQTKIEEIKSINIIRTMEEKEVVDSFTWRIVNWYNLLSIWKERPLLGYGLQATSIINPWKTPSEEIGYAPHNDFIRYLVETGIVGLTFYIIFIVSIGYYLFRAYKVCKDSEIKSLLYIILGVFIAWQTGSLVDNFITSTTFQFYFWSYLGTTLKCSEFNLEK